MCKIKEIPSDIDGAAGLHCCKFHLEIEATRQQPSQCRRVVLQVGVLASEWQSQRSDAVLR